MSAPHVVEVGPPAKSGKRFAYSLRGLSTPQRAEQAVNGVPQLCPPYTDGQLAVLYHVSRADLKCARERTKSTTSESASTTLKDFVREHGVAQVWDALVAVLDEHE
jgi:hypothetical protein